MATLTRPAVAARRFPARLVAGTGCVVAGGLHAAAALDHADVGWWVPAFFAVTALAQAAGGVWVLATDPPRWARWVLLAGTVGLLLLFLVVHGTTWLGGLAGHAPEGGGHAVHTEGAVSLGTAPDVPEAADALGLWTVGIQAAVVAAGALLLPPRSRRWAADALLGLGVLVVLAWMTGVLA